MAQLRDTTELVPIELIFIYFRQREFTFQNRLNLFRLLMPVAGIGPELLHDAAEAWLWKHAEMAMFKPSGKESPPGLLSAGVPQPETGCLNRIQGSSPRI